MARPLGSKYAIDESIGRGAMGEVFSGFDQTGRPLAFKILHSDLATDPEVVARFVQERSILLGLSSQNLVGVEDLVIEGDTLAIVMELVKGHDLRSLISDVGTFRPSEICRLGAGIAAGLGAVHQAGIVHRDIKPENILIDESGTPGIPKVTDFGISSLVDSNRVRSTVLVGTPQYIAPEVSEGKEPSAASDLYALGIVLYELACGVTPFAGGSIMAVLRRHSDMAPGRPSGIPDALWDMISWLLSKNREQRPASAQLVSTTLEAIGPELIDSPAAPKLTEPPAGVSSLQSVPTQSFPELRAGPDNGTALLPTLPGQKKRSRLRMVIAAAAILALLTGFGIAWAAVSGKQVQNASNGAPVNAQTDPGITPSSPTSSTPVSQSPTSSPTPSATVGGVPNVVGMMLPQARLALGDNTPITTVDKYDPSKPDGTVIEQSPVAGLSPTGSVQLTVARSAVVAYLDDLRPVAGDWQSTSSVAISGKTYAHSASKTVCGYTYEEPGSVEYNLGRNYRTFHATAGMTDDSGNSAATVLLDVFADGRKVYSGTIVYGQAFPVAVDMTNVLRMKIQWQPSSCRSSGNATLALGEAGIEGIPGQVPTATPTP